MQVKGFSSILNHLDNKIVGISVLCGNLGSCRGKAILVSWCNSCREEIKLVVVWLGDTHECSHFGCSPSLTNTRDSFLVVCCAILVLLWCFTLHSWSNQSLRLAQTQFYGIQAEIPQKYLTACIVEDIQLDA